jgi:mercuric ion transport protein
MWQISKESKLLRGIVSYAGLFTSLGTLLCCAIPSTLVLLGLGASLAGFLNKFPQLIWLSENKEWVFGASLVMLTLSFLSQRYARSQVCPVEKNEDCENTKSWSGPLLIITFVINLCGAFYAFILPRLL